MKRIGQKQLSLLLCLVLLFTMVIPAGARASDYFNNTYALIIQRCLFVWYCDSCNAILRIVYQISLSPRTTSCKECAGHRMLNTRLINYFVSEIIPLCVFSRFMAY